MSERNVLVTGAAGRLGSVVCRRLHDAGYDVVATDRRENKDLPVPLQTVDLLEPEAALKLMDGVETVVHLGNHPGAGIHGAQVTFNENVSVNMNVFQAARERGTKKIIFASTIQVVAGTLRGADPDSFRLPYLPLDGEAPGCSRNTYALSKEVSEHMLRYFAREAGIECIAIRFPFLPSQADLSSMIATRTGKPYKPYIHELFSYLTREDAAALVEQIIQATLPGFRVYFPVSKNRLNPAPIPRIVEEFFADVPLKRPVEEMTSLVDLSRIEKETGWSPVD